MGTGLGVDPWEDFHVVIKPVTLYGNSYRLKILKCDPSMIKNCCSKRMCLILLFTPGASLSNITISFFSNHNCLIFSIHSLTLFYHKNLLKVSRQHPWKSNIAFPNVYMLDLNFLILNYDFNLYSKEVRSL